MFPLHMYAPKSPHLFYPSFTCVALSGPLLHWRFAIWPVTWKKLHVPDLGDIQRYTPITLYLTALYHTAPLYNIIIIFDTVLLDRKEILNKKNTELNSTAIFPLWHESSATVGNVKIVISEKIVLLLHPHVDIPTSLVVMLNAHLPTGSRRYRQLRIDVRR